MNPLNEFEFATATVQGKDHRKAGRNNQDAFAIQRSEDCLVAVVADGCGSAPHSEIGATLGAWVLAASLVRSTDLPVSTALLAAREDLTRFMRIATSWARGTSGASKKFVRDHLLFTLVGVILNQEVAAFFYFGDGLAVVNGTPLVWHSPNNTPGYIGYDLLDDWEGQRSFQRPVTIPMDNLDDFIIATDGAERLLDIEKEPYPGKTELVGPISQLWEEDRYFTNPDALRRHLSLVNREGTRIDEESEEGLVRFHGLLPDDTTVIVGRRARG